jgi:hypothetical protein
MTIAAGFVCRDGILLCADSQYSGFGKEYRDKLFSESTGQATWAFAIAGDEDYAKTAIEDSNEAVYAIPPEEQTVWSVRKAIRRAIKRVLDDYKKSDRDLNQKPEFLIAISARNDTRLFSSSDTAFLPIEEPYFGFRGTGAYIGNFIMNSYTQGTIIRGYTVRQILPVAIHVLSAAKRQDASCGGGSQFMMVSSGVVRALFENSVWEAVDRYILEYEFRSAALLISLGDLSITEDEFKERVDSFANTLTKTREMLAAPGGQYHRLLNSVSPSLNQSNSTNPQPTTADSSPQPPSPESPGGSDES